MKAYLRAQDLGFPAQPGIALLALRQGDIDGAAGSIKAALAAVPEDHLRRAILLPTHVEIALASGDIETAGVASQELEGISNCFKTSALRAVAAFARGSVQLARGDAELAIQSLRDALIEWTDVRAPYEIAQTRVLLAEALQATGDHQGRLSELRSARSAFLKLGAEWNTKRLTK